MSMPMPVTATMDTATAAACEVSCGHLRQLLVPRNQPCQHSAQNLPWWPVTQEALPWSGPPAHALMPHGHATAIVGGSPALILRPSGSVLEPSLETSDTEAGTPPGR